MSFKKLMATLLTVLLISTLQVSATSLGVKDVLIQLDSGYYGNLDVITISNKLNDLDGSQYSKRINGEDFGYYPGVEFISHYIEAESPVTLTTASNSVFIYTNKLKENNGKLEYDPSKKYVMEGKQEIEVYDKANDTYISKIVNIGEDLSKYESDGYALPLKGATVEINEPGDYLIFTYYDAMEAANIYLKVVDKKATNIKQTSPSEKPNSTNVKPTSSKVLVNGKEVTFDAYIINDNNYFKLRDLAKVVNGTDKEFEVEWNNEKRAINLVSNKAYTEVGGELVIGDGKSKAAVKNTSIVYKDGEEIKLEAYTIGNNNYFKLRDIAQAFDIGVTWDEKTKTVGIDTAVGYESENSKLEVASVSAIASDKIKVTFKKPVTAGQAGEYYSSIVQLGKEGAPWEVGRTTILNAGQTEIEISISSEYPETKFPEVATYEFYLADVTDGEIYTFEVSKELIK